MAVGGDLAVVQELGDDDAVGLAGGDGQGPQRVEAESPRWKVWRADRASAGQGAGQDGGGRDAADGGECHGGRVLCLIEIALSANLNGFPRQWKEHALCRRPPQRPPPQMSPEEAVRRIAQAREIMLNEVHKVIIGQEEMIEQMLICMFARGHCLTIGVPGLAKTLTISTLAKALALKFSRIQFTPDLMPSDITGTEIIDQDPTTGKRTFRFVHGPIFANIVLADEINRTPPKTQAALLQAMQEYEVTSAGKTYKLEPPFFVMATQNPIEQEGTYPLPEAQLDRFMLSINIGYPSRSEERDIVMATTQTAQAGDPAGAAGAGHPVDPAVGPPGAGQRAHGRLRGGPGARHAAQGAAQPRFHQELAGLGGRPARGAEHRAHGQGPGDPPRAVCGHGRRHPHDGVSRAAAPHLHQLQRRRRRGRRRPGDREDPADVPEPTYGEKITPRGRGAEKPAGRLPSRPRRRTRRRATRALLRRRDRTRPRRRRIMRRRGCLPDIRGWSLGGRCLGGRCLAGRCLAGRCLAHRSGRAPCLALRLVRRGRARCRCRFRRVRRWGCRLVRRCRAHRVRPWRLRRGRPWQLRRVLAVIRRRRAGRFRRVRRGARLRPAAPTAAAR